MFAFRIMAEGRISFVYAMTLTPVVILAKKTSVAGPGNGRHLPEPFYFKIDHKSISIDYSGTGPSILPSIVATRVPNHFECDEGKEVPSKSRFPEGKSRSQGG